MYMKVMVVIATVVALNTQIGLVFGHHRTYCKLDTTTDFNFVNWSPAGRLNLRTAVSIRRITPANHIEVRQQIKVGRKTLKFPLRYIHKDELEEISVWPKSGSSKTDKRKLCQKLYRALKLRHEALVRSIEKQQFVSDQPIFLQELYKKKYASLATRDLPILRTSTSSSTIGLYVVDPERAKAHWLTTERSRAIELKIYSKFNAYGMLQEDPKIQVCRYGEEIPHRDTQINRTKDKAGKRSASFSLEDSKYRVDVYFDRQKNMRIVELNQLEPKKQKQILYTCRVNKGATFCGDDGYEVLEKAGDFDDDGKIDLLLILTRKYANAPSYVFLSSAAKEDELVRAVAVFDSGGC